VRWSTPPIRSAGGTKRAAEFPDRGPERTGEISFRYDKITLAKVGPRRPTARPSTVSEWPTIRPELAGKRYGVRGDLSGLKDALAAAKSEVAIELKTKDPMFTPEERAHLRFDLLEYAARDCRISGAAITGSSATEQEDQWSDIDLAFGVVDAAELPSVLSDWTARMYDQHLALHHLDVKSGAWIYRVFLLPSTLQVDLAFVPATEFRALAPTFRLMSGRANEPRHVPPPQPLDLIGLGWLYALHARSCIARQKLWQAEHMISGIRDHVFALACIRHDLPAVHGRGIDQLPSGVTAQLESSLVRELNVVELLRAFRVVVAGLLSEIRRADSELAGRLQEALTHLTESSR